MKKSVNCSIKLLTADSRGHVYFDSNILQKAFIGEWQQALHYRQYSKRVYIRKYILT